MPRLVYRLALVIFILGSGLAPANSAAADDLRLAAYLEELNRQGQSILFSSDLVSEDLLLASPPPETFSVAALDEILRPFELSVRPGPSGSLLVIRSTRESPESEVRTPAHKATDGLLTEIVVTSSLRRIEYLQSGNAVLLDRELATRVPGAAEEAIRLPDRLPGVANGGISTRSHVRGGEANETLYLLDGLRLYEPFHLKDFQSVATVINPAAISGMDFYSGAFPARYGDRMSAVMDISLRQPEKDVETELALSFFNASVLSLGRFGGGDKGNWLFAARRGNLDLIADVVKPEIGSPDYQDFLGHAGWNFGSRADISANFLLSVDKISLADTDRGEDTTARYENRVFWVKWDAQWNEWLKSSTVLSFTDIDNSRAGTVLLPNVVAGELFDQRDFRSTSFKQDWVYSPSPRWMISFGVDGKHLDGRYRFRSTRSLASPFDQVFDNAAQQQRNTDLIADGAQYAVYTEVRWRANEQLTLDAGLRWDNQSYTTAENDQQSSPRFSLLYQATDCTELRFGWGQYSQAQEVNELQVGDGNNGFFPAQRAEHVVANLKHQFANYLSLDLSVFRKSFRAVRPRFENAFNQLSLLPELQFDRVMIDADTAEASGAEILLSRGSGADDLFWWIGYTWSQVEDTILGQKQKRSWDQTNAWKLGASWRWGSWDFSAAGLVRTGWPRTNLTLESATNPDGSGRLLLETSAYNGLRHTVFHSLDIRVSRDLDVRRGSLQVFIDVSNLYNRENPCCTEYSLQRDSQGVASLGAQAAYWLPLVPSLGVVWRF